MARSPSRRPAPAAGESPAAPPCLPASECPAAVSSRPLWGCSAVAPGERYSGFDARQEVLKIGLQICLVIRRRHTVDARRAILARQAISLVHPFEVDQMMQRGQPPLG